MSEAPFSAAPWTTKRLRFCASYNDEVLPESTDDFDPIQYIEISDVSLVGGIEKSTPMLFHEAPSRARRRVRGGDILVSTVRTYLKAIAAVNEAPDNLIVSTGFCVVRPHDGLDAGYAGWVAKSEEFVGEVVSRSVGVSYPAINASQLVDIEVPLPPLDTQKRIAAFLDEKTAQIDGLIEKKRALLERLAEKRQAIITQAVTKGLNPAAPMKDSGIDWLGEIPAHWETYLVKRKYAVTYGVGGEIDRSLDGGTNLLSLPNISKDGRLILEETPFTEENDPSLFLNPGDLLFNWRNGSSEHLGKTALFDLSGNWTHVSFLLRVRPTESGACTAFLRYFLNGMRETGFFARAKAGVNNTFNLFELANLMVAAPPTAAEQQLIAKQIETYVLKIDATSTKLAQSLQASAEYRSALITAAVTGQIEGLR